jgi:putative phosphoesterase
MDNLRIAVVSDSHDNATNLEKAAGIANEQNCSYLFHLGDFVSPYTAQKLKEFKGIIKAVYGNCDDELPGLQKTIITMGGDIDKPPMKLELEGKQVILLHEPFLLDELIKSQETDFIFYGHLHKANVRKEGKTLVLNPGDSGGWVQKPTFFVLDLDSAAVEKISL